MFHHRKKTYEDKKKAPFLESERLRQEIEDLEDALILHARFRSESDNSVKEMIRKELGTTRWEHGGEGKLTTYRSGKDLCNQGMKIHTFPGKKSKDKKKQSDDKTDDKPKIDKENSNAVIDASADKKVRKLKKMESSSDKKKLRDITAATGKLSELKITSVKATATICEPQEMTFDTADLNQDAIVKTPGLKDETSVIRKKRSGVGITNYNSELQGNRSKNKHSKARSHNSISESSKILDNDALTAKEMTKADVKVVRKRNVSQLFIEATGNNFTTGIQPSFKSTDTNYVITESQLNTQELDGRMDTYEMMFDTVNPANVSDSNKFVNELLYHENEFSKSKTLEGNVYQSKFCNGNSYYNSTRFLSSNQSQAVDNNDKWAIKSSGFLVADLDCVRVPGNSLCADGGCIDFVTDFDARETPQHQTPSYEGNEQTCSPNRHSYEKEKLQTEKNEDVFSVKDCSNVFSTTRTAFSTVQSSIPSLTRTALSTVQSSVPSLTNIVTAHGNTSVSKGLNHEQEQDTESMEASYSVLHADLSVAQHSCVRDTSSSLPESDCFQGKSSHAVNVESWLHSLDLESVEHYVQLFHDHQLDMSSVQFLSATDLREMGIHAIGPIMKIMKGVLVLGRDKDLLKQDCRSHDYTIDEDRLRQYGKTVARNMDNHTNTFSLTETSIQFSHDLKNYTDNNNMCNVELAGSKTWTKTPASPVLYSKEPGQDAKVNILDTRPGTLDLGTTTNLKMSDDDGGGVCGVSHVVGEMLEGNSKPKHTVNRRQEPPAKRRVKQPALGVCGKPPVTNNGIAVAAQKFNIKQKQIYVKEANGRNIGKQKQIKEEMAVKHVERRQSSSLNRNMGQKSALERSLSFSTLEDTLVKQQVSEFNDVSIEQRNEKDCLDVTLAAVCKSQSRLSNPEQLLDDQNFRKSQQPHLKQDSLELPSSAKRRNAQARKQQQENTGRSNVDEEERPLSVKAYTSSDNQTHKPGSQYKDLQSTQQLPGQGNLKRREPVNDSLKDRSDENIISSVAVGDDDDVTDSATIKKDTTVAKLVAAVTPTPHLLKSKRSQHASLRVKEVGQLRRQQNRQPERHMRASSSHNYILDSIRKVELNRDDVVFSEKDLLGSGTFSQVFKGTYQGSEVAVKRLQIPLQTRDLNYFVSEISVLQELRHSHVAMLLGVCSRRDQFPLIVMEFLACGNLHSWLHGPSRTDLKREEFYQIAHDVSAGMLYLHHHQPPVLHLDLKPRNILIGHGARAKVADFGFSKLRCKDDVKQCHTRESLVVLDTPAWTAPEMFTSGEITPKADVYSFGMVLWEMLTRKIPYENCSVFQVLEHVQVNRRPTLPSDCPKGLSQIVQKCWDQNPAARPGFKEILKCLEHLSETSEWITSLAGHENQVMSLNFTPENSRPREYSLKEGPWKAKENTSSIDHIDLISLSSWDNEENSSCNEEEGEFLNEKNGNNSDRSRLYGDIITCADNTSGIQELSDRKSELCSTDVELSGLSLQFSSRSSGSCLSLPDNDKDNEQVRHNTADKLSEMYLTLKKPSISVSKSQDSLRSSLSVKKLLPLRHSLDRSKVIPASCQGKGLKPQGYLNLQAKSQTNCHFVKETVPGMMCNYVETSIDFVEDTAVVGSRKLANRQATLDLINMNEDVLHVPCSEALLYVPSFHDKDMPARLTTRCEPSELFAGRYHESSNKDQSSDRLKESLGCSHVEMQSVNTFVNSPSKTHDHTSYEAQDVSSGAGGPDLDSTKGGRIHIMNKDSQIQTSSPRIKPNMLPDQATNTLVILKTHKSKQSEADRSRLHENNCHDEKENPLDTEKADVCFVAEQLKSAKPNAPNSCGKMVQENRETQCSKNIANYGNPHSLVHDEEAVHIQNLFCVGQCSPDSAPVETGLHKRLNPITTVLSSQDACLSTYTHRCASESSIETLSIRSGSIKTSTKSNNIQMPSEAGSQIITISARSDNIQPSTRSDNMQPSTGSDNIQVSARSDNIQTSARSDNIQTSTRSDNIKTFTRSHDIETSTRSYDALTKSGNIPTPCNMQISFVTSDNVQIPSARSHNLQAPARLGKTSGFSEVIDHCTDPNNYSSSLNGHETTAYESDSDSSEVSDISQDSLNKDAATCPKTVKISNVNHVTRHTSNALVIDIHGVPKNKMDELLIIGYKNTENSSAYTHHRTDSQGCNAQHTFLHSEQNTRTEVTELSMAATNTEAVKYNKIYNTVVHRYSGCMSPEVQRNHDFNGVELTKCHTTTLQKELLLREKQTSNIEFKKNSQLEEAPQHNLTAFLSSQKRHFLTELKTCQGAHVSETVRLLNNVDKPKDVLPLESKQILKQFEGTSRFSIEVDMLLTQKKLLRPVVTTPSSFSVNTQHESEDRSPSVITILKKAMTDRRFAMADILESQDLTPETSWSLQD